MNPPPKRLAAAIALLDYPDDDTLAPNEAHWREVARWLLKELRLAEAGELLAQDRWRDALSRVK